MSTPAQQTSDTQGPICLPTELLPQATNNPNSSVFSRAEDAPVHNVPMRVINRPLPSELDENKVKAFMAEMEVGYFVTVLLVCHCIISHDSDSDDCESYIQRGDSFTPIEVVKVKAPLKTDPTGPPQVFYFAMGGCHRYEATKRLGWETIRARIINVPANQMRIYLGSGSPF